MKRFSIPILLTLVSLSVTFAIAELFLQHVMPVEFMPPPKDRSHEAWRGLLHRASDIPGLNYELAPNMEKHSKHGFIQTNSFGMRDTEPLLADTPGLIRIACVGDSFTFGFSVAGDKTYPNILEQLLQSSTSVPGERSVDVLNFGVGGYSTKDEALIIKHKVLTWKPRLIVIGYVLNDPEIDPRQPLHAQFAHTDWWRRSHVLRLAAKAKFEWDKNRIGGGDYLKYLHAPKKRKWQSVITAFHEIYQATAEKGIPVIVVLFPPIPSKGWEYYEYYDINSQIVQAAIDAGLDTLDLTVTFKEHEPANLKVKPNDGHPSILGHRLAAEAIRDKLLIHYPDVLTILR